MLNFYVRQICKLLWVIGILKNIVIAEMTTEDSNVVYKAYYEIKDILKQHKIIPDVIAGAPEHKVEVAFNGEDFNGDFVDFGNYLTIDQIQKPPKRIQWPHLADLKYTLMLISPDYPTRESPTEKEWQYWLVTNIHGGDLDMAQIMTEYSPPTSIEGKAPHRFVFLVFRQRTKHVVKFTEPEFKKEVICKERANFSAREFADKYNFPELVAINFFLMKPTNVTKAKG